MQALLRALIRPGRLCDAAGEAPDVARLLADPEGLGLPERATRAALPGGDGAETIRFHPEAAWLSHANWFLAQMEHWGWTRDVDPAGVVDAVYRPSLVAQAAHAEGLRWPEDEPASPTTD